VVSRKVVDSFVPSPFFNSHHSISSQLVPPPQVFSHSSSSSTPHLPHFTSPTLPSPLPPRVSLPLPLLSLFVCSLLFVHLSFFLASNAIFTESLISLYVRSIRICAEANRDEPNFIQSTSALYETRTPLLLLLPSPILSRYLFLSTSFSSSLILLFRFLLQFHSPSSFT